MRSGAYVHVSPVPRAGFSLTRTRALSLLFLFSLGFSQKRRCGRLFVLYIAFTLIKSNLWQALPLLKAAWDLGINTIDTANTYSNGDSERIIGNFIEKAGRPGCTPTLFW